MSSANLLCDECQTTRHLLMIRPSHFGFNPQTAESNQFQRPATHSAAELSVQAAKEFDAVVTALDQAGVQVFVVADVPYGGTPDAVFPNNWISTHSDGTVVLYPMAAANEAVEKVPCGDIAPLMQAHQDQIRSVTGSVADGPLQGSRYPT
ncbi:MAG: arginine deiminase-related protein, partial [Gammaproteobacteria bacterium]